MRKKHTRVSVCTPSQLSSPADNIGEDIRRWPGFRIVDQGVDFFIRHIVDTKTFFDQSMLDEELGFTIRPIRAGKVIT